MADQGGLESGWLGKLNIGSILIALPVAHLLVASLYTWGWMSGFGANVAVLADPRDLFSVSISRLVVVYALALAVPAMQSVFMFRNWKKRQADRAARTLEEIKSERKFFQRVCLALILLSVLAVLVGFDLLHRGAAQGLVMLMLAQLLALPVIFFLIKHLTLKHVEYQTITVGVGLLCASIGYGMADGNFARYATYDGQKDRVLRCAGYLIQRRFGENYVAVAPSGLKVVTDLECKVMMTVPKVRGEARREIHWRPYPHVHYVGLNEELPASHA